MNIAFSETQNTARRLPPEARIRLSSDDLVRLLLSDGGQVLGSDEHGGFVRVRQRLVFVRRATVVDFRELKDVLRTAGIGPGRFDILCARLAAESGETTTFTDGD
jgi:hypothetical protein